MKHRIEQLELDVYLNSSFNLPPCLFNCNTLRVLILKVKNGRIWFSFNHFSYPTSAGLPFVHTLSLTRVYFEHGSDLFSGEKFPLLRKLWLRNCEGMSDLDINCPELEILKVEDLELDNLGVSGTGLLELHVENCFRSQYAVSSAKILAPGLRSLYWESEANVEFTIESFRDLNTGFLFFNSVIPNAATLDSACRFFSALCFARSLSVGSQLLKILSNIYPEGGLRYSFNKLTTLELHTDLTKDEVKEIICFLRSSPVLHTITISCSVNRYETLDDDWYWSTSQSQNLKSFEHHLKVARIDVQGNKMSKSVVYLVKFLLRSETALQEMILTLRSDPVFHPVVQQRIRFEIMKFALPSSNVIISFLPQDQSHSTAEELY